MNKRLLASVGTGVMLLGGVIGFGATLNQSAKAATTPPAAIAQRVSPAPAGGQQEVQDQQHPEYSASIKVDNPQNDNETRSVESESAESQALQDKAKITPEAAGAAAVKAVPGTVKKVSLDNENGNLVYSVEVQTATGTIDVKVDAGNGKALFRDSGHDEEEGQGAAGDANAGGPDNDNAHDEE